MSPFLLGSTLRRTGATPTRPSGHPGNSSCCGVDSNHYFSPFSGCLCRSVMKDYAIHLGYRSIGGIYTNLGSFERHAACYRAFVLTATLPAHPGDGPVVGLVAQVRFERTSFRLRYPLSKQGGLWKGDQNRARGSGGFSCVNYRALIFAVQLRTDFSGHRPARVTVHDCRPGLRGEGLQPARASVPLADRC